MGRLRVLSGEEVRSILARHGFVRIRQRGSHVVLQKKLPDSTITVPVPQHREVRIGTLSAILRQSDRPRSTFES